VSSDTAPVRHRIYKHEHDLKPKDNTKEGILSTNKSNSKWPNAWLLKKFQSCFHESAFLLSSRSRCSWRISFSSSMTSFCDRSMDATRVLPSRFHRFKRSNSALRRRYLVSIFSHKRHSVVSNSVMLTSLMPQVSPVRYS
jgi:hypothetical protein